MKKYTKEQEKYFKNYPNDPSYFKTIKQKHKEINVSAKKQCQLRRKVDELEEDRRLKLELSI